MLDSIALTFIVVAFAFAILLGQTLSDEPRKLLIVLSIVTPNAFVRFDW